MASYEDVGEGDQPYRLLGFGSFGVVTKVKRKSDQQVLACKSIRNIKMSKEQVQKEYDVIRKLHHQNVVQYVDMQVFPGETRLYMEYCNRSSLTEVIIKNEGSGTIMAEGYIWNLIHQLTAGVNYRHSQQPPVLHRDIKPGNVLLSTTGEGKVTAKLADFGLSTTLTPENAPSTYVGTGALMAPEVTNLSNEFISWTEKCDIFSLGCTFYYISSYRLPFDWHLESDMTPPPLAADYEKRLKDCIMDTMSFDPSKRPSASDILRTSRSQQQDDFGIYESLSIIPITIVKKNINEIEKGRVRKGIDRSAITENREVYDADGNPEKKAINLGFRAKEKFLVGDNKPAEAPRAKTFLEGGETVNATTMLPSQDTIQPGVNTKPTETITKAMQAPAQPQGHTLDDDDAIVGAVPGPPTWIRDRPGSEGPVKITRSSLERRKGQSDLSKNQSAIALEETRRQQGIKQRKEATSRRGKADTKDRWEKNERADAKKRRENGEEAVAKERREKESTVHKNRWALALEESRRRYEAKQRKDAKNKYQAIEEQRLKAVSGIADNWRPRVSEQARWQQEINPIMVVEEASKASDEEQDEKYIYRRVNPLPYEGGDEPYRRPRRAVVVKGGEVMDDKESLGNKSVIT